MADETDSILLWRSVWIGAIGVCFVVPLSYIVRYRRSILKHLDQIEDDLSRSRVLNDMETYVTVFLSRVQLQ